MNERRNESEDSWESEVKDSPPEATKSIHVTNDSLTFVRHPLRQSINKQGSLLYNFVLDEDDDDENSDLSR